MMRVIVIVAILVCAGRANAQLLSPGPLAAPHASIDSDSDCEKCHESGKKVLASLCLACHKDLGAEVAANRGLHGGAYRGQACEKCHVDHMGRGTRLIHWPGGAPEQLDHAQTGYRLDGGHKAVACAKCHRKTSPAGAVVYLGTSTACAACHADPHQNRFSSQCERCHVPADWKQWNQPAFNHDLSRYPLTGKHAGVTCDGCHGSPAKWQGIAFAKCDDCHADPHKRQFAPQACAKCHTTATWEANAEAARANHPKLSLANGHAQVACKTCHDRGTTKPPSKGLACVGCHAPVHVAKFGTRCEECHASIKFVGLPESIGRASHDKTRYPLAGKHADVECAQCHPKSKPEGARYRKLRFDACRACHADEHKGEFKPGECAACHTLGGFAPSTFGVTKHVTTGYTLDGRHAATPCGGCHGTKRPRLGWKLTKTECSDCHANPHGDQFASEMATGGCAHCHTPYGWTQAKVDHSIWPLTGAHASTACVACHGPQAPGAAPVAYRGIPRDCEGCHEDIHVAQFRESAPARACAECHATDVWQIAAFDHERTRFALDGAHGALACDACHRSQQLRDGTKAVRWRLGYTDCKACHADPHGSPR